MSGRGSPTGSSSSLDREELGRLRAEHATVVQALQAAIRDSTRLIRLFAVLSEAAPLARLLDRVLATLSELFLSDVVVLLDATEASGFVPLAAIGLPMGNEHRIFPNAADGYAVAALKTGMPITVTQARTDSKVDPYLRELDVETAVWLPVAGDEAARRGVLILARCRPLPFIRADVDLLMAMAYRVGLMVERSHAEQERRGLEVKLRQAAKSESLGRMAAAIAHHFNNMLAVVVASLDLALDDLPTGHSVHDDLVRAREATKRAAKTSELMLAYLGQGTGNRECVDLVQVVREALSRLQSSLPARVRLISDVRESDLFVSASAPQIIQLLGNLITNAWEAMFERPGEIRVGACTIPSTMMPKPQVPTADWSPKVETYVCLSVSDTGCGMAPETVEKIFDPFFTTKFVGRGLGLPVVLGTVRGYEGMLTVESVLGQGTTVRVYLPLVSPADRATEAAVPMPAARPAGPALVLIAEDEDNLRHVTQRIFNRLGYEVMTAADGVEAVELFRQRPNDVRLVVLDLSMPRMDGWAALEAIRALRPDVPVVLSSGHDQAHVLEGRPAHHFLSFLHKPYTLEELRSAVEKVSPARTEGALARPRRG